MMSIYETSSISPKTLSNSPLKGENSSLPLREGQGGSKSPFKGDLEGLLREGQEGSFFWAYLPNNLQKNVVPLQQISIHASSAHVNC